MSRGAVRSTLALALCACGAAPAAKKAAPTALVSHPRPAKIPTEPVDIIARLSAPLADASWIVAGPAQLVLGGTSLQIADGEPLLEVDLLEEQGNDVRVGIRLDHARFALWTSRSRLLAVLARDQRIDGDFGGGTDPIEVVLRAGAGVRRLAKKDGRTQIRYVGAVEVEGWVSDDILVERGKAGRRTGRVYSGHKQLMLTPGAVIRSEPRWMGKQLAVLAEGFFLDTIKQIDEAWVEVAYEDSDVRVHGFVSRHDPPGHTHRRKSPELAPPAVTPNATVADHTCLYVDGEPVGFITGDREVMLDKGARPNEFTLAIDSPWGAVVFDTRGPTETDLEKCGF